MIAFARLAPVLAVLLALLLPGMLPSSLPSSRAEPGTAAPIAVNIDRVDPQVVINTSGSVVTVTGTVVNVSDQPIRDVVARLERAPAITSTAGLRTELAGSATHFEPVGEFVSVADSLAAGKSAVFTFRYPLRSAAGPGLDLNAPGVYPLLVNVNGTPESGEAARLAEARTLLPVTGLPASDGGPPGSDQPDSDLPALPPDTDHPVLTTLLWPLADRPRLAPGLPGGTTPVRLVDDDLATSLAAGGRLDSLLAAAERATGPDIDPRGDIAPAICLAIDPDLLVTVNAMTAGYTVSDSADGLGPASHPGAGQAAASQWLDRLRILAPRMCVIATPYAQVDLDALARVGDTQLSQFATTGAADLVDQLLGIRSVRGGTVLGDGPITTRAVDLLGAQGNTVIIAPAHASSEQPPSLAPLRLNPQVSAAPFDPNVGAALAAMGKNPQVPGYLDESLAVSTAQASATARRQDALGAIMWRDLNPDVSPRTQLLVPPAYWQVGPADADSVLAALSTAIRSGLAKARPLPAVLTEAAAARTPVDQPEPGLATSGTGFDDAVVDQIVRQVGRQWDLTAALSTNQQTGLTGLQYTAPLREDMLRALSQAEPAAVRNQVADRHLAVVRDTINELFAAVTVVNPGDSYTLATERSPLPLALRNDLGVPIRVRLQVDAPPGMAVTDIGEQELPAGGYLPVRIPVEVRIKQRMAVDISLHTPAGVPLGEPVRLSVHSNAYGKPLFFITLTAAAVLILLTARRLWHRSRGMPDRADLDRPSKRPSVPLSEPGGPHAAGPRSSETTPLSEPGGDDD